MVEVKKLRIKNLSKLTPSRVKIILKKLDLRKYYEHIPHIINKLNNIPPPRITREQDEQLCIMFEMIQIPFNIYCPETRTNFLGYSYVLYKFCELLELDDILKCFPLHKSDVKIKEHDKIWEKICEYLHWEFIPSI